MGALASGGQKGIDSSAAAELAAEPGTIASASALRCPLMSHHLANRRRSPAARRRLVQTRPAHRERWQPDRTRERRAADCALTSHDDRILAPQASAATSRARLAPRLPCDRASRSPLFGNEDFLHPCAAGCRADATLARCVTTGCCAPVAAVVGLGGWPPRRFDASCVWQVDDACATWCHR